MEKPHRGRDQSKEGPHRPRQRTRGGGVCCEMAKILCVLCRGRAENAKQTQTEFGVGEGEPRKATHVWAGQEREERKWGTQEGEGMERVWRGEQKGARSGVGEVVGGKGVEWRSGGEKAWLGKKAGSGEKGRQAEK